MRRILVVLDLNGTLLCRIRKGGDRKLLSKNPFKPEKPDHSISGTKIYLRPNCRKFLGELFGMDHVQVAVWTSMQQQNADPLVEFVFGKYRDRLLFVWYRPQCDGAPLDQQAKGKVRKPLGKIWDVYSEYNHKNTILVDDSKSKALDNPKNLYLVPEFELTSGKDHRSDTTLAKLIQFLISEPENVQTKIASSL
ncbi:NLI interacting factor [Gorgonomyces haynaldii]|nr:NLI interacting factor [Gorgonomyces haynaldii]